MDDATTTPDTVATTTTPTDAVTPAPDAAGPPPALADGKMRTLEEAQAMIAEALGEPVDEAAQADAEAAAAAAEAPPEVKPEVSAKSKAIAERAKKDAEFHRKKLEVEAKAKRIADLEALTAKVKAGEADPDDLLTQLGVDYRTITESKLKNGKAKPTEAEEMRARIDSLEAKLQERERAVELRELEATRQPATQSALSNIREELEKHGDKYDAVSAYGEYESVLKEMQDHLLKTATEFDAYGRPLDGEVLTPAQAADIVEQRLAERLTKGLSTKYARRHQQSPTPGTAVGSSASPAPVGARTLTNGHGSTGAAPRTNSDGVPVFDTIEQAERHLRSLMGS